MISRGQGEVIIGELPGGRSDEPWDMGEVQVYETAPLSSGDRAPLFETTTLDGRPIKLADYRGKHVLLNFWRSDRPESLDEIPSLKAAQSAWGKDDRFVLLGLNADSDVSAARKFVMDHGLSWTQCTIGKATDLPMRYRLRRPTSVLIGPDGLILHPDLRGAAVTDALADVLGTK
jgi:peroxiredoxin